MIPPCVTRLVDRRATPACRLRRARPLMYPRPDGDDRRFQPEGRGRQDDDRPQLARRHRPTGPAAGRHRPRSAGAAVARLRRATPARGRHRLQLLRPPAPAERRCRDHEERRGLVPRASRAVETRRGPRQGPQRRDPPARGAARPGKDRAPVVIDCGPPLNVLSLNAVFACDLLLVPVSADFLSLQGAQGVDRALNALEPVLKRRLPRRYVLTRFDARRKMSSEIAERMAAQLRPEEICMTRIRENVKLAESPALALDVFRHAPGSHGARDYAALVEELVSAGFLH